MSIWRWADMIEPVPETTRIALGEGDTPLVRSRRIGPAAGLKNLFFKLEPGKPQWFVQGPLRCRGHLTHAGQGRDKVHRDF